MPGIQDLVKLALVSQRQDVITFTEVICSDDFKLSITSDFSDLSFFDSSLILIDASIFYNFDIAILEYVEKFSDFSICILPPDVPSQVISYVEKSFKFIVPFPINAEYFHSYCMHVMDSISSLHMNFNSQKFERKTIPDSFSGYFCGNSSLIKNIRIQILNAACSKTPVLILGETGTGKTTAAHIIHTLSDRKHKKMVSVSLSTIVETLAESTFFGHIRGSFTNADYECRGYFEVADGSTLFLDELGLASLSVQAMLLTVLETGNFKKIGDNKEQHTDVRLIFATNANIKKMLRSGRFLQELYFRICDNVIKIPPLRAHKEDIREMVMHYLGAETTITDEAIERLENYSWPGNIRELHKCIDRARLNCHNSVITADSIDFGDVSFLQ